MRILILPPSEEGMNYYRDNKVIISQLKFQPNSLTCLKSSNLKKNISYSQTQWEQQNKYKQISNHRKIILTIEMDLSLIR